jgi:crotonobetainyl-CoA:carnitine CoA-transferase CaiB-like acyl-CoA transferase
MQARFENRDELLGALEPVLKEASAAEWERRLGPLDLAVGAVKGLADTLDSELVASRGMVVSVETDEGPLRMIGNPIHFGDTGTAYRPPPRLHEHTEEILGGTRGDGADAEVNGRTTQ